MPIATPFAAFIFTLTLGVWYLDNTIGTHSLLLYHDNTKHI